MSTLVKDPITVMQRRELKYLLSPEQTDFLLRHLEGRMAPDAFGLTSIASLYYDTPDRRIIRASMEKGPFKEKLRLRSYGLATEESPVYLELKRKARGIVYKRRIQSTIPQAERFLAGNTDTSGEGQIHREIAAFLEHYPDLAPACLIIYDRVAYYEPEGDLRLTLDHAPRYRTEGLDLTSSMAGFPLLPEGWTILEIKVQNAVPLWLAAALSEGAVFKTSFSKYGEAYRQQLERVHPLGKSAVICS